MILGLLGGGQLGKMLALEAKKLSIELVILDPDPFAPAATLADTFINKAFDDEDALNHLAELSDVITYEREDMDVQLLLQLKAKGHRLYPDPESLLLIQDKYLQKKHLKASGLPTSDFVKIDEVSEEEVLAFKLPCVQKLRFGGFDGHGVKVLKTVDETKAKPLVGKSILERCIDIDKELAVIAARSISGDIIIYPVVEMAMNEAANILDDLIVPARISVEIEDEVKQLAKQTIEAFDIVGVMGIEFFLSKTGDILINEVSPRTHNSGHYTNEACVTNQYAQQLRAIMGWPLGSTNLYSPAVMLNLLGEGNVGDAVVKGLELALAIEGVSVTIYGKKVSKPGRKMGHVVITDNDVSVLFEKTKQVKQLLTVSGG